MVVNDEFTRADGSFILGVDHRNVVDVDATAAGPGDLKVEMRDPSGDLVDQRDVRAEALGRGRHRLILSPTKKGLHKIYLFFSDLPVPSAYPIVAHVEAQTGVVQQVSRQSTVSQRVVEEDIKVHGDGLSRAIVKEPADFIIDASNAPRSKITAILRGDNNDIPVRLHEKSNHIYKAVYTPLAGGEYDLHINIDGRPLRQEPFKVQVQDFNTPAGLIHVDHNALKLGIIGEDIKTTIDARRAGAGQLSAQCEGPSQLEYCELYDNRDGTYVLRVTPKELGKHVLSVKYANEHVPGSPFIFNVASAPDASKVKVYGPGIEHGILATFKSNFVVETKGAGAGQLTVRVRGPKGAFNVEMQRDRQQDRTIHCKYEPKEPGDYQVEVKWHKEHVPGKNNRFLKL